MQVIISNVVKVKKSTNKVRLWCEKNLVIPNPEYSKKVRLGLWVGSTPEKIYLYEKHGDELVLPFGILKRFARFAPLDTLYTNGFTIPNSVYFGKQIPLYDYQLKAVDEIYASKYGILQSPAGSGKTQMGIALVKKFKRRALWLTHTVDLLNQSKQRAEMYMDSSLIGTITEGKVNIGNGITFATIQTMCKLDLAQYKNYWDVIIVDECHRVSGSPTTITQFYKVLNSLAARHKIGLSATVYRADGMIAATHALLGEIVYTVPKEAIGDRIVKIGICPINTKVEISRECLNTDGMLNYTKLITYLTQSTKRNGVIINAIKENEGKSSLILSDRLSHLECLMNSLPDNMQEYAVMVRGGMSSKKDKEQRKQAIEYA